MGRHAIHRIRQPHDSPRFKDKIMMLNYRRGPHDDIWAATFAIESNGKTLWLPRDGISLGERDYKEALEKARDKYNLMVNGVRAQRDYTLTKRSPLRVEIWGTLAAKRLRALADSENAKVQGKGKKHNITAWYIERHILPYWKDYVLDQIVRKDYREWITFYLRVKDKDTGEMKIPTVSTLGKLDAAMAAIWREARDARDDDDKPRLLIDLDLKRALIPKGLGAEGNKGAIIDSAGVRAVAAVMTDPWVNARDRYHPEFKAMFRAYVAMLATTGIRAGAEAKRVQIGNITFGKKATSIKINPNQGKHEEGRRVSVFTADNIFPTETLLQDHITWRKAQGASDLDEMFVSPDGDYPDFGPLFDHVLALAGQTNHPMTGKKRTAYSFRHFYATRMIHAGHTETQIAELMGTSTKEIHAHYKDFFAEYNAERFSGEKRAAD